MAKCIIYTNETCLRGCPGKQNGCLLTQKAQTEGNIPPGQPLEPTKEEYQEYESRGGERRS